MNEQLEKHAREQLKEGLAELPESWQLMFKRMYSHNNLELPINEVVDNMDVDKLDNALRQVKNSIDKLAREATK